MRWRSTGFECYRAKISALPGQYVSEYEAIAFDRLADVHVQRVGEPRPVDHEGVEFAVLPARIDPGREVAQQFVVVPAAGQRRRGLGRVYACDDRADTEAEHLAGESRGGPLPQREQGRDAAAG